MLRVSGGGIAARHAWVWIAEVRMQVEDLACGTLVNGHPIEGRVEVEYPASVQVGELTLVVEVKEAMAESSVDVTIPQRTPTRYGKAEAGSEVESLSANEAPLQGKYFLVKEIARGGMG